MTKDEKNEEKGEEEKSVRVEDGEIIAIDEETQGHDATTREMALWNTWTEHKDDIEEYDSFKEMAEDMLVQEDDYTIDDDFEDIDEDGEIKIIQGDKDDEWMDLSEDEEDEDDEDDSNTIEKKKKSKTVTTYTSKKNTWDIGEETHTKCPTKDKEANIVIGTDTKDKIESLLDVMDGDEWLGMIIGKRVKTDDDTITYVVKDIDIPEQKVTAANAEKTEPEEPEDSIGVIHSHHHMDTFWSGTDEKHSIDNNEVSIVVDNKMNAKAAVRHEANCGRKIRIEADVMFRDGKPSYIEWAEEMKDEKITKKKKKYSKITGYGGYGGYSSRYKKKKKRKKKNKSKKVKKPSKDDDDDDDEQVLTDKQMNDIKELATDLGSGRGRFKQKITLDEFELTPQIVSMMVDKSGDYIPNVEFSDTTSFQYWLQLYAPNYKKRWDTLGKSMKEGLMKDFIAAKTHNKDEGPQSTNIDTGKFGLENELVPKTVKRLGEYDEEEFVSYKHTKVDMDEEEEDDEDND